MALYTSSTSHLKGVVCCVIAWTFSSTPKSLGGITVIIITLKRWKLLICW